MPNLHPIWTTGRFDAGMAAAAVRDHHDGTSNRLMTIRLDCDDALRADVVARLQAADDGRPARQDLHHVGRQKGLWIKRCVWPDTSAVVGGREGSGDDRDTGHCGQEEGVAAGVG